MSQILEYYNNNLDKKYYKTLKKVLHKQHNNSYDNHFENLLSEELISETESVTNSVTKSVTNSVTKSVTNSVTKSVTNSVTNSVTISDMKITEDTTEHFYYKKSWNKLNIIHKKIKIKEYISNLMLTKDKKKVLTDKLLNLLNNKKLNKKTDVDYDSFNGKIITITVLKCKNEEYFI
jgi:hypothetical protein